MDNYDNQLKSLEHKSDILMTYEQAAGSVESLQSVLGERERLLHAAIADLTEENDCKYCAYKDQCSAHKIARNFAYKGCSEYQWRGAKMMDITAEVPTRKQ